jgi:hypothetical protein
MSVGDWVYLETKRKIFGSERDELTETWRWGKLLDVELCGFCSLPSIIRGVT